MSYDLLGCFSFSRPIRLHSLRQSFPCGGTHYALAFVRSCRYGWYWNLSHVLRWPSPTFRGALQEGNSGVESVTFGDK